MAIKIVGTTSGTEVDSNTDKGLYVETRPPAFDSLGVYHVSVPTGAIAAILAANSTLFSMRWTDATRFALIRSVQVSGIIITAPATQVPFDIQLDVARSFTASDTGGTAVTLSGNNQKMRTSMGAS